MIGKTISHYNILEKLGEGGMGDVYKAKDTKLDRIVALKFLPVSMTRDKDVKARFTNEAKAASALDHPNVCTVFEIDETEDGQLFISMGYYEGQTIEERIKESPLEVNDALDITIQIARGLNKAHKKKIVHRDIKSANIIVTKDGVVKIVDFGIAKLAGQTRVTQDGTSLGTATYKSPEQTLGKDVDHRTDIWSLGVVLYEMLAGISPFQGEYEQAVVYSILNEEPKPITSFRKEVSIELERILNKALAKDPNERYQNLDKLIIDLKHVKKEPEKEKTEEINPKNLMPTWINNHLIKAIIVTLSIAVILLLFNQFRNTPSNQTDNTDTEGKSISLIAVLPFSNTKPDPETDYFGFAIADQIIGDLTYLKNIIVRPSSSIRKYEKQVIDPVIAGDDLKVNYILTGNYLKQANIIRLNVELINVITNEIIWREPIEVDYHNTFELQDIVAQKVVEGMNVKFTNKEINRTEKDIPGNPLAYEYYLRGISYPSLIEGNQLAIDMLNKSIEIDSSYAPAYNELGRRIHQMETFGYQNPIENKRPENYYLKALYINNELMSALSNLANIYTETNRADEAVELTKQMLEINPNNAEAHFSLGYIYRYAGMNNESIYEMEKARAFDPKNPRFRSLGVSYFRVGDYEKALNAFGIDKGSTYSLGWQGYIHFRQGNYKQANVYFDRIIAMEPEGFWARSSFLWNEIMQGNNKEGLSILNELVQSYSEDAEMWYYWATEFAVLGDKNGCIKWLQRAVDGGYFNYPSMLTDSFLDSIRDDKEFQKVLQKAKGKHLAFKKRFFDKI